MKALVLGHSFVRRLRDWIWMRDNDREMSRGSLDVHLHGVGGRTVRQMYNLDLKRVDRIHPDVILLQLGGGGATSVAVPPPRMSWWDWSGLSPCFVRNVGIPQLLWPLSSIEGDPGVFLRGLMTVRRNGSLNVSLENLVLSSRGRN